MNRVVLELLLVLVLGRPRVLKFVGLLCDLAGLPNDRNGQESDHGDHEHVKPTAVVGKLAIRQRGFINEVETTFGGAFVRLRALVVVVEVHQRAKDENDYAQVGAELEHLALKEQVQEAVSAAVQHPVLHLQFVHDRQEHALKNRKSLRLGVQTALVHLLNVDVLVDRQLSCQKSQGSGRQWVNLPPNGSNQIFFHSRKQTMR